MKGEKSVKILNPSNLISSFKETKACSCTSIREFFKLLSQILIPLMIGIFTLVISLQQHNLNKENRRKDLDIAEQLRKQQYQINEQRRTQELTLDEARRFQDLSIAETKQRDSVFNVYIRDLTNLLLENNYQLTRSMLNLIIRPMTLTVLRQLDSTRKVLLIKFLYESKMLRTDYEHIRVDLTDGDLNGIELNQIQMRNLSLIGTSMINSSFYSCDLSMSDFEQVDLTNAHFIQTDLSDSNFYRSRLVRTQFNDSTLTFCDFHLVDLTDAFIWEDQLRITSSNMAILPNGNQAKNESLIHEYDQCLLYKWIVSTENSIHLTEQCFFVGKKDNITMKYRISLISMKRLLDKRQALFHFYFQTNIGNHSNLHIDFIYMDSDNIREIHRESAFIVSKTKATNDKSLFQYVVSANYPDGIHQLYVEFFLNQGDIFTKFQFYLQHFDFNQYQHH